MNTKLNESKMPKASSSKGGKVVGTPIDENSFKIKIVDDAEVIKNDRLTQDGASAIYDWAIKQEGWLTYYKKLNNLTDNFMMYSIKKDTDKKTVIIFELFSRADYKKLKKTAQVFHKDDLQKYLIDSIEGTSKDKSKEETKSTKEEIKDAQPTKSILIKPIPLSELPRIKNTDQEKFNSIINPIKSSWIAIKNIVSSKIGEGSDSENIYAKILSNKYFNGTKEELKFGRFDNNTKRYLEAIIKATNLKDEYGDTLTSLDDNLLKVLNSFQKINESFLGINYLLVEQENYSFSKEFDLDVFINTLLDLEKKSIVPKMSVQEVQKMIIDKFSSVLGNSPTFQKFKNYGADGKHGPTTSTVISMIKKGFGFSETDGSKITPEFIKALNEYSINESFINLKYRLVEQFNVDAALNYEKTISSGSKVTQSSTGVSKEDQQVKIAQSSTSIEADRIAQEASDSIVNLFNDKSFWKEFKGLINDDEAKAAEAYKKHFDVVIKPIIMKLDDTSKYDEKDRPKIDTMRNTLYSLRGNIYNSIKSKNKVYWTMYFINQPFKKYSINADI